MGAKHTHTHCALFGYPRKATGEQQKGILPNLVQFNISISKARKLPAYKPATLKLQNNYFDLNTTIRQLTLNLTPVHVSRPTM